MLLSEWVIASGNCYRLVKHPLKSHNHSKYFSVIHLHSHTFLFGTRHNKRRKAPIFIFSEKGAINEIVVLNPLSAKIGFVRTTLGWIVLLLKWWHKNVLLPVNSVTFNLPRCHNVNHEMSYSASKLLIIKICYKMYLNKRLVWNRKGKSILYHTTFFISL